MRNQVGFDDDPLRVCLNRRHSSPFRATILEGDKTARVMIDPDGVTVRIRNASDSLPHYLTWPVEDAEAGDESKGTV